MNNAAERTERIRGAAVASVDVMKRELQALIERLKNLADEAEPVLASDAVQYAAETSRLDILTLALTVLSIVLALGGVFAFIEIRYRSRVAAEDTARSECRTIAKELLGNYVNDEMPDEVRRLVELIMRERDGDGGDYGQQDTTEEQP